MGNIGISSMPKTYKSWANGYRSIIDTEYKKGMDYRKGIFYMDTTENAEDRLVEVGTTSGMTRWNDGKRANQSDIKEGFDKRIIQIHYGEEVPFGRLARKFQGNNVSLTRRGVRGIGKDAYLLQQKSAYSLLSYGFSNTNTYLTGVQGTSVSALGPDGKRFFSVAHAASPDNATTWGNVLTDNASVGEDALKVMIENLHNQIDDQGQEKHYGESGYEWLVSLQDFPEASRIVGSMLRAGTTDNDKNVYEGAFDGRPITVRWVPWLSDVSTTAHFLTARDAVEDENVVVLTSTPFYSDDYYDDTTKTYYVRGECGFEVAFVSGRGFVGSLGTDTGTYTA